MWSKERKIAWNEMKRERIEQKKRREKKREAEQI